MCLLSGERADVSDMTYRSVVTQTNRAPRISSNKIRKSKCLFVGAAKTINLCSARQNGRKWPNLFMCASVRKNKGETPDAGLSV